MRTIIFILFVLITNILFAQNNERNAFDEAVKRRNYNWKGWAKMNKKERQKILNKIDSLDFSENYLQKLPEEIAKCTNLKHLNLLGNENINWQKSDSILNLLSNKTEIHISTFDLDNIPKKHWKKITGIKIINKELSKIPENILSQKQLIYLDIRNNYKNLYSISPNIKNLSNLRYLNLSACSLNSLPKEIGELKKLEKLFLELNYLNNIPTEIGNLQNLRVLTLSSVSLEVLPKEIGKLKNLTRLDLSFNKLRSLPKEIGKLKKLRKLDLEYNEISLLPKEIGNLKTITELNLNYNGLKSLPKEISKCSNLSHLHLLKNNFDWQKTNTVLSLLNKEIGIYVSIFDLYKINKENWDRITGIKILDETLEHKSKKDSLFILEFINSKGEYDYSKFPNRLFELKNLKYLDCSFCYNLPKEIGRLRSLTKLNLYFCGLKWLPEEIGKLSKLTELDLSSNKLNTLPKEIKNLNNLKILNLSKNKFKELPKEITELKKLTTINLFENDSLDIGNVLNYFSNIQKELKISTNEYHQNDDSSKFLIILSKLKFIPEEIENIKHLTELDLSENQFESLTKEIEKLKKITELKKLYIYGTEYTEVLKIKQLLPNCRIIW